MLVRDIMTHNVITISSNAHIIEARRLMDDRNLRRLPVVDKGKLVGMLSASRLERAVQPAMAGSVWELSYSFGSLYRTPIKDVMQKEVVTVTPDMTVEEALALAQSKRVGGLVVVDDGKVAGIVTTNDFFYRIVNPVLGVGEPGVRVWVPEGGEGKALEEIIIIINKLGMKITTLHVIAAPTAIKKDLVVHLDCKDVSQLIVELTAKGYTAKTRKR